MKAAVLYGNNDLRYEEYPEPSVKPGFVKLKVCACGVCGSDMPRISNDGAHYYPIVLGHEFSGIITEVGEGVTSVAVNDHAVAVPLIPCLECQDCKEGYYSLCKNYTFIGSRIQGGFADYVVLPEKNVVKIDNKIPFEQAALCEPATVSLHGLKQAGFKEGINVAIIGGGIIGQFALEWARILGAKTTTLLDVNEKPLEVAKRLGADHVVNSSKPDFMNEINDITEGRGFDFVAECVGATPTIKMALNMVKNHGMICMIGTPKAPVTLSVREWENINRKECFITGSWMSSNAPFPGDEWTLAAECFADGRLVFDEGMIHKRIPLSQPKILTDIFENREVIQGRCMFINYEGGLK